MNLSLSTFCQLCQRPFLQEKTLPRHGSICQSSEQVQGQFHDLGSEGSRVELRLDTLTFRSSFESPTNEEIEYLGSFPSDSVSSTTGPEKSKTSNTSHRRVKAPLLDKPKKSVVQVTTGTGKHQCKICGMTWSCSKTLNVHMRSHIGHTAFSCGHCERIFSTAGNLRKHVSTVHTDKQTLINCSLCRKSFVNQDNLQLHIKKDHELKDREDPGKSLIQCRFCMKKLKSRDYLTIHERTHTGERPFNCRYCNKAFICFDYRTIHERGHTGEKPYRCGHCDTRFTTRSSANRHIRNKHPC